MRTVRAVCTCGLPQSSCPVASAVSGAGDSPAPSRSAGFQRVLEGLFESGGQERCIQADQAGRDESRRHLRSKQGADQVRGPLNPDHVGARPAASRQPPRSARSTSAPRGAAGAVVACPHPHARRVISYPVTLSAPSPADSNGVPSHSRGPSLWLQGGRRAHPGRAVRHTGQGSYFLASDGDDGPCPPGQSRRRWLSRSRSGEGRPPNGVRGAWCHPFHPLFTCIGWTPHTGLIW
jgi:hypothetical protein